MMAAPVSIVRRSAQSVSKIFKSKTEALNHIFKSCAAHHLSLIISNCCPFLTHLRVYFACLLIFLGVNALMLVKIALRSGFSSGLHKGLDIILVDFLFFQQQLCPFDKQFLFRFEDIKGDLVLA